MSLPLPQRATLYAAWHRVNGHTDAALLAYGQACRDAALEEAATAIEDADARRIIYLPEAVEIIRSLKS